jgi:NAD(P)-dependent dehydrogenase (short-subunit alcohol dehydrogenase family)
MAQGLTGKVAVVTGAARGIGRAIALWLAKEGAAVIVNYAGSTQQAQETVGLIEQGGRQAVAVQADVSKVGDVRRLFDACFEKFRRLDILVNNAGMMFTKPVAEVGEEEFDRIFSQGKTDEQRQRFAQLAALGRLGQPQDSADVVALLAGEDARWITGQNIRANGRVI